MFGRRRDVPADDERHCDVCGRTWTRGEYVNLIGHGFLNAKGIEITCTGYPCTWKSLYVEKKKRLDRLEAMVRRCPSGDLILADLERGE